MSDETWKIVCLAAGLAGMVSACATGGGTDYAPSLDDGDGGVFGADEEGDEGRSADGLTIVGSGPIEDGVSYRAQRYRVSGREVGIAHVWIDLSRSDLLVETAAQSMRTTAADYVSRTPRAIAAINANFFDYSVSSCSSPTWNVVGLAMSAGVRFRSGSEYALDNRFSITCDYTNYCIPQPYSAALDSATRAGTSRWTNIVSGGERIIHARTVSCPGCTERDAQVAIGLAGRRSDGGFASMYFVVSEGSETLGQGITLAELARWMVDTLGVEEAVQMDGGGSAQLAVEGYRGSTRGGLQLNDTKYPVCLDPTVRRVRSVPALFTVRRR